MLQRSILPNILEKAVEYGMVLTSLKHRPDEHRTNCPFCVKFGLKPDKGKHLYINTRKNTFKCYRCVEGGGVIKFISLMEGKSEKSILEAILEEIKKKNTPAKAPKKPEHPALGLTGSQLRLIHLPSRYEWPEWWADDPEYKKWWLDEVWRRWNAYMENVRTIAFTLLVMAIQSGNYSVVVKSLKSYSEAIGSDIVEPCLAVYSQPVLPWWALKGKSRAIRLMYELENENKNERSYKHEYSEVNCPGGEPV